MLTLAPSTRDNARDARVWSTGNASRTDPRAPTTRAGGPARSAVRVTACAGASGIGTIPLGVRSDGNVRACRRCGVDVTDRQLPIVHRTSAAPWFRRVPQVAGTRTAARARRTTQIRRRPRGARTRYRGGREASTGGSSTLAARHPLVTRSQDPAPSRF